MAKSKPQPRAAKQSAAAPRLFTLAVLLLSGPISQRFAKRNPKVIRTLAIRGDQTLVQLHHAIFEAFDREEEHLYEFHVGGKGPHDPNARRYVLPTPEGDDPFDDQEAAGEVNRTTIEALDLRPDESFGYWFDFGDDWWHQIGVVKIEDSASAGKIPRIVQRIGDSPPQYED